MALSCAIHTKHRAHTTGVRFVRNGLPSHVGRAQPVNQPLNAGSNTAHTRSKHRGTRSTPRTRKIKNRARCRTISLTVMMRARLTQMAKLVTAYMLDEACCRNLRDLTRSSRFSPAQHTEIMDDSTTKTSWCSRPLREANRKIARTVRGHRG